MYLNERKAKLKESETQRKGLVAKMSEVNDLSNEEENNLSCLNILNCSLNGKREDAKTQEIRKRSKTEKTLKQKKKFRKKFTDNVFGFKGSIKVDYLNSSSDQPSDEGPDVFLNEKCLEKCRDKCSEKCPQPAGLRSGNLESELDYLLLEDNCKENHIHLGGDVAADQFDNVTISVDIGLDDGFASETLDTELDADRLIKANQRSDKTDTDERIELIGEEYGTNAIENELGNENFDEQPFLKEKNLFLFKNEELLVKCEVPSAPVNEKHLALNNILLNDQTGDYSFQSDAFTKTGFDLDKADCFDYAEISFGSYNLSAEDLVKVDEKCETEKRASLVESAASNQMSCTTLQQNLTDYPADRSAVIVPNPINPGEFPTYSSNTSNDLPVLEAHLNAHLDANFRPPSNPPNRACNESENINNLELIESADYPVEGLRLNGTLLNALLSNQIIVSNGDELNDSLNGQLNNQLNGQVNEQLNGLLRRNKMVSSRLSSIGSSISSDDRFPLSGELIGRPEIKYEMKSIAHLTGPTRDRPKNDCFNKSNSISIKLADDSQTNFVFARNLDDYLLLSSSSEQESLVRLNGTIAEPEVRPTNHTPRKRPNKPKSNEPILQLTNPLPMPISSDCLSSSPTRLNSPNFPPLSSSGASSESNCLSSLYSLANNISQFTASTATGHQVPNCLPKAIKVDSGAHLDRTHMKSINRPESNHLTKDNNLKNSPTSRSSCNPFSIECRIPLPNTLASDHSILVDNKNFIKRRNQRERIRVKSVNDGFDRLRKHLPADYEQYLDAQSSYSSCYLKSSASLNSSSNSTNDGLDFKNYTAFSSNSNEAYPEEDRKPLNGQFKDQIPISYSNSSSSSTASIPTGKERRLSKVETLRLAINYIKHLESVLAS